MSADTAAAGSPPSEGSDPVILVPGPSLRRCVRAIQVSAAVLSVAGLVEGLVILAWGGSAPAALVSVGAILLAASALALVIATAVAFRQKRRESDRGYTTSPTAFFNLATVDDRSGVVLRRAGDPLLTMDEYRIARARAGGGRP